MKEFNAMAAREDERGERGEKPDPPERKGPDIERPDSGEEALRALEAIRGRALRPLGELVAELPPGLRTGFEVQAEIGRGAFSRVFRAMDRALKREVALKTCLDPLAGRSPEEFARFVAEARVLASLDHPNIVRIYSVQLFGEDVALSLELIEGRTLDLVLKESGPLSPEEAAQIGATLCSALAAIHAKGLVHRDLKPANVMRASGGRIVLLDFGMVRSTRLDFLNLALPGAGTPLVMAPEQFGPATGVGPRADLYGLGALLYWLHTGRFPVEAKDLAELSSAVRAGRVVPLLDRRPGVPAGFASIVHRALALRPEDRFASAGEMEAALRGFLTERGEPVGSASGRSRKSRSSRGLRLIVGVLLAAGLLGAGVWISKKWSVAAGASSTSVPSLDAALHALRVKRDGEPAELRLDDGGMVLVGDLLVLKLSTLAQTWLYLINEDSLGNQSLLFPMNALGLQNPVEPCSGWELPGLFDGERQAWSTDEAGVEERFLLLGFMEPIPELERLLAGMPAPERVDEIPAPRELDPEDVRNVLRGVSQVGPAGKALSKPAPEFTVASSFMLELEAAARDAGGAVKKWVLEKRGQ